MSRKWKLLEALVKALDKALEEQENYFINDREILREALGLPKLIITHEQREENRQLVDKLLAEITRLAKNEEGKAVIVEQKPLIPSVAKYGKLIDNAYIKPVDLSKAVLWKERCLSLPPGEIARIRDYMTSQGISSNDMQVIFRDVRKGYEYRFEYEKLMNNAVLKSVGQEPQYYFSLDFGKRIGIEKGGE